MADRTARPSTGRIDAYLGARVRELRGNLYTQEQLALSVRSADPRLRWNAATVASIETGRRNITLDEVAALCRVFGVGLPDLLGDLAATRQSKGDGPLHTDLNYLSEGGPPRMISKEKVAEITRAERLHTVQGAVLGGLALSADPDEPWRAEELALSLIESYYGRDLLAERDARVLAGDGTPTWVTRRLAAEVAALFQSGQLQIIG